MASEISLYNDFIDMKARNYNRVNVLKPYLFVLNCLNSDRTSLELKGLLPLFFFFFFQNCGFQIWGGAYLRVRLIHRPLRYISPQ